MPVKLLKSMDYNYYSKVSLKTFLFNRIRSVFKLPFLEKVIVISAIKNGSSFIKKLIPPEYLYPNPTWRKVVRNDINYHLNISNSVDHAIYFGYKDQAAENFIKMFNEDSVVFDIGANIGATSLPYAKKCFKGRVYSYEPDQTNYKRLVENINLNQLQNVQAINIGLGDKEEEVKLYCVSDTNPGMNRVLKQENVDFNYTIIKIRTLDFELFERLKLSKVDAVKIDVEGFETNVLNGAAKTLLTFKPKLFIELIDSNLRENGSSASEIVNKLIDYGYDIFCAFDMRRIEKDENLNNCQFDIIAIKEA